MGATGGGGSFLVFRAREAAMRAKSADLLGITKPPMQPSIENPMTAPIAPLGPENITPAQPPQPASTDVPLADRAFAEVESFLAGVANMPLGPRRK